MALHLKPTGFQRHKCGFRPNGTFVRLPLHDVATLTEAFRRAVLRLFVRRQLLDRDPAGGMLAWPVA